MSKGGHCEHTRPFLPTVFMPWNIHFRLVVRKSRRYTKCPVPVERGISSWQAEPLNVQLVSVVVEQCAVKFAPTPLSQHPSDLRQ